MENERPAPTPKDEPDTIEFNSAIVRAAIHDQPMKLIAALGCVLLSVSDGMEDGRITTENRDHMQKHTEDLITAILAFRAAAGCTMKGGH